jgi:hypothetical protein
MIIELGPHKLELKDIDKMTDEELRQEVAMWRNMFLNLDDESRFLLWLIGKEAVIINRRNEAFLTMIARVVLQPRFIYILKTARRYDPLENNYKIENVLERMDYSNVQAIQEVLQHIGTQDIMGGAIQTEQEGETEETGEEESKDT